MVFSEESSTNPSSLRASNPNSQGLVSGMVSQFSQETSMHGVKFLINRSASKPRRLLWSAVFLAQICALLYVIVKQFQHFNNSPVLTKVITRYVDRLNFPAVTMCVEPTSVENNSLTSFEKEILRNAWNRTFFASMEPEEYKTINIVAIYKKLSFSADDLVKYCRFDGRDCLKFVRKSWGKQTLCYSINSLLGGGGESSGNENTTETLISRVPGAEMGLTLWLELSDDSGVKLIVHEPDEKITLTNSEFLQLAPDTSYYIGLKVRENKFLPLPYKAFGDHHCEETSSDYRHPLVNEGRYTLRACHDACSVKLLEDTCGCKVHYDDEENVCDPLMIIDCYQTRNNSFEREYGSRSCDCRFPCEDVEYSATISGSPIRRHPLYNSTRRIKINIHFDRLRIESTQQVEDYTSEDIFASVGGQLGLFLGASIITLIEVGELLVRCGCSWISRRMTISSNAVSQFNHQPED